MVGPRITAHVDPNLPQLMEEALKMKTSDLKAMSLQMDRIFRKNERALFASEGSSGGSKWPDLKPATLRAKKGLRAAQKAIRKRGFKIPVGSTSLKIMQRSGELKRGLTTMSHPDHVVRVHNSVFAQRIGLGTTNILAKYHGGLEGGAGMNTRLPRRNVLQMTVKQRDEYDGVLLAWFKERAKQFDARMARGKAAARAALGR